ncbi:MAG: hypothetical protein ABSH06_00305 [Thermodesulfobacteriota bacterium]
MLFIHSPDLRLIPHFTNNLDRCIYNSRRCDPVRFQGFKQRGLLAELLIIQGLDLGVLGLFSTDDIVGGGSSRMKNSLIGILSPCLQ